MVELEIWLYGKPSWDMLFNGVIIRPALLRRRAKTLSKHLYRAADLLELFLRHGWQCRGTDYALRLFHKDVRDIQRALSALRGIGVQRQFVKIIGGEERD